MKRSDSVTSVDSFESALGEIEETATESILQVDKIQTRKKTNDSKNKTICGNRETILRNPLFCFFMGAIISVLVCIPVFLRPQQKCPGDIDCPKCNTSTQVDYTAETIKDTSTGGNSASDFGVSIWDNSLAVTVDTRENLTIQHASYDITKRVIMCRMNDTGYKITCGRTKGPKCVYIPTMPDKYTINHSYDTALKFNIDVSCVNKTADIKFGNTQ